jgi:hypothetical protein
LDYSFYLISSRLNYDKSGVLDLLDIFHLHNNVEKILKRFYCAILSVFWIPALSGLSCLKTLFKRVPSGVIN